MRRDFRGTARFGQNIPIRTEEGRKLRDIADKVLYSDFGPIEQRVAAYLVGDEPLILRLAAVILKREKQHNSSQTCLTIADRLEREQ